MSVGAPAQGSQRIPGLEYLHTEGVRNLHSGEISGLSQVNVFHGANGSGKTSLLEAIFLLGHGQSFKTANIRKVINYDCDSLRVVGRLDRGEQGRFTIGIELGGSGNRIRAGGESLNRKSALVDLYPVQVINPDSHQILEMGPKLRRQVMDWGVFHVEHSYMDIWKTYIRNLKQRNHLLRSQSGDRLLHSWNQGIVEAALALTRLRIRYLQRLNPVFGAFINEFMDTGGFSLEYNQGWPRDRELEEVLDQRLAADRERGFTQSGPHRSDLNIVWDGRPARERVSRGQQKLVVTALKLAQLAILREHHPGPHCLLVDDLAAELDSQNRNKLLKFLQNLGVQTFITSTERELLKGLSGDAAMFHVKHGKITPEGAAE